MCLENPLLVEILPISKVLYPQFTNSVQFTPYYIIALILLPLMKSFIIKINALKQIFERDPLSANPTKWSNTLK